MMRIPSLIFGLAFSLLMIESSVRANFQRDVVSRIARKERRQLPLFALEASNNSPIQDELLSKAIPLADYEHQLKSLGIELPSAISDGADGKRSLEEADDYYVNEQNMYSFSGYSLKYAKCQPVQQFSSEALDAGEYSPMVTQDIVILRLCPYKSCSSSRQYGCHYNYAEYAIGLDEYVRIMLHYRQDKQERLCEFCANCAQYNNQGQRKLENDNNGQNQQQANGDDQQADANGDDKNNDAGNQNNNGNDDAANQNNGAQYNNYANYDNGNYYNENEQDCYTYSSYCTNYYNDCEADGDDQQNKNQDDYYYRQQQNNANYIDDDEYFNYLGCSEIADKYGAIYFVRPSCDESGDKITMAIFYDEYCSQYAGNDISKQNLDVAFNDTIFEEFYNGSCIDCSESNYPPGFEASSYMCNKIHNSAADCTSNMIYDLFDGQRSDSTECSFIESIRFGTYDQNGEIAVHAAEDAQETVTDLQKLGLVCSALICTVFVIYACYLHHSMTNLLIKSLSHRELLPPSRHSSRNSKRRSPGRRRSSKSSRSSRIRDDDDDDEDEDDWEPSKPLRTPV